MDHHPSPPSDCGRTTRRQTVAMQIRNAASLIETLIVLGIIGVLVSLLLPAVQFARERAREAVCKNNLHQIKLALENYHSTHKKSAIPGRKTPGVVGGWAIDLLPFLEQSNLANLSLIGSDPNTCPTELKSLPRIMRCPSQRRRDDGDMVDNANYAIYMPRRLILDVPNGFAHPWLASPRVERKDLLVIPGPHSGGYFDHHGNFLLDGDFSDANGNSQGSL